MWEGGSAKDNRTVNGTSFPWMGGLGKLGGPAFWCQPGITQSSGFKEENLIRSRHLQRRRFLRESGFGSASGLAYSCR